MSFQHLPALSLEDVTADLEQLQQMLTKLAAIPTPAETTAGNTKALTEILAAIRAV